MVLVRYVGDCEGLCWSGLCYFRGLEGAGGGEGLCWRELCYLRRLEGAGGGKGLCWRGVYYFRRLKGAGGDWRGLVGGWGAEGCVGNVAAKS